MTADAPPAPSCTVAPAARAATYAWRPFVFAAVATAFFVQGAFVYLDPGSDAALSTLSDESMPGQQLWRDNNCQSCHQVHGFGGFLGPDLTNAWWRVPQARIRTVLRDGAGRMPAFHFDEDQQNALIAYLADLDWMGQSTPLPLKPPSLLHAIEDWSKRNGALPEPVARAADAMRTNRCEGCHIAFTDRGILGALDLSLATSRRTEPELRKALTEGRNSMPNLSLEPAVIEDLLAMLRWLGEHRDAVSEFAPLAPVRIQEQTWFAFPRAH